MLVPCAASAVYEGSSSRCEQADGVSVSVHYSVPHQRPYYHTPLTSTSTRTTTTTSKATTTAQGQQQHHRFLECPIENTTAFSNNHFIGVFGSRDGYVVAAPLSLEAADNSNNNPLPSTPTSESIAFLSSVPTISTQNLSEKWKVGSAVKSDESTAIASSESSSFSKKRVMIAPTGGDDYEHRTIRSLAISPGPISIVAALTDGSDIYLFRLGANHSSGGGTVSLRPLLFSQAVHQAKHLQGNIPTVASVSLAPFKATGTVSKEDYLAEGGRSASSNVVTPPFNPSMKWVSPSVLAISCEGGAVVTVAIGLDADTSTPSNGVDAGVSEVSNIKISLLCRDVESEDIEALLEEYGGNGSYEDEEAVEANEVGPPVLQVEYAPLLDGGSDLETGVLTITTENRTALLRGLSPAKLAISHSTTTASSSTPESSSANKNKVGKVAPISSCYFSLLDAHLCDATTRTLRSKVLSIFRSLNIPPLFPLLDKEDDDTTTDTAADTPILRRVQPGVVQVGNKARQPGDFGGSFVSSFPYLVTHQAPNNNNDDTDLIGWPTINSAAQYSLVDTLMQWDAFQDQLPSTSNLHHQVGAPSTHTSSDWPKTKPSLALVKLYTSRHNERLFDADSVTGKVIKTFHYTLKDGDPQDKEAPLGLLTGIPRLLTFNATALASVVAFPSSSSMGGRRLSSASSERSTATTTHTTLSALTSSAPGYRHQSVEIQRLLSAAATQSGITDGLISSVWGKGALSSVSSRHSGKSRGSKGSSSRPGDGDSEDWNEAKDGHGNSSLQKFLDNDAVSVWSQSRTFAALLTISSEHGCTSAWQFHWGGGDDDGIIPATTFINNVSFFRFNSAALVLCSNNTILALPTAPSVPVESFFPKRLHAVSLKELISSNGNGNDDKSASEKIPGSEEAAAMDGDDTEQHDANNNEEAIDGEDEGATADKKRKKVKKVVKRVIVKKKKDGTIVSTIVAPPVESTTPNRGGAAVAVPTTNTPAKSASAQKESSPNSASQPQWPAPVTATPTPQSNTKNTVKPVKTRSDSLPPIVAFEDAVNTVANPKKRPAAKPITIREDTNKPLMMELDPATPRTKPVFTPSTTTDDKDSHGVAQDDEDDNGYGSSYPSASPNGIEQSYSAALPSTHYGSDAIKRALADAAAIMARATASSKVESGGGGGGALGSDPAWLASAASNAPPTMASTDAVSTTPKSSATVTRKDSSLEKSQRSDHSDDSVVDKQLDDMQPVIVDEKSYKTDESPEKPEEQEPLASTAALAFHTANLPPRPATAAMYLSGTIDRVHARWEATSLEYTSHPLILQSIVYELLPAVEQVLYLAQVGTGILRQVSAYHNKNRQQNSTSYASGDYNNSTLSSTSSNLNSSLRAPVDPDVALDKVILVSYEIPTALNLRGTMSSSAAAASSMRSSIRPDGLGGGGGGTTPTTPKAHQGLLTGADREGIVTVLATPGLLDQLLRNVKLGMLFSDGTSDQRFNASYLFLLKLLTIVDAVLLIAPSSALKPPTSITTVQPQLADRPVCELAEDICATLCSVFTECKHNSPLGRLMARFQSTRAEVQAAACAADLEGYGSGIEGDDAPATPSQPGHFFDTLSLKEATQSTFLLTTAMQWVVTVRLLKPPKTFRMGTSGAVAGVPGHFMEERVITTRNGGGAGGNLRQSIMSPTGGQGAQSSTTFQPPVSLDVVSWLFCGTAWGQQPTAPPRKNEVTTWLQASIGPLLLLGSQGASVPLTSDTRPGTPSESLLKSLGTTIASGVAEAICGFNEDRALVLGQTFSSRPLLVARCFVAIRGYASVHSCNEEVSGTIRAVYPSIQRCTISTARARCVHEISEDLDSVTVRTTKEAILESLEEGGGTPNPMMQLPSVFTSNIRDAFILDFMSVESESLRTLTRHLAAEAILARSCTVGEIGEDGIEASGGHRGGGHGSPQAISRKSYMRSRRISTSRDPSPSMTLTAGGGNRGLGNGSFAFGSITSELATAFTFEEWLQEWQKQLDVCWEGIVTPLMNSILLFGAIAVNRPKNNNGGAQQQQSSSSDQQAPALNQYSQSLLCALSKMSTMKRHNPYKRVSHFPSLDASFSFEKWSEAMGVQQKKIEKLVAKDVKKIGAYSSVPASSTKGLPSALRSALLVITSTPSTPIGHRLLRRDASVLELLTSNSLGSISGNGGSDDEDNIVVEMRAAAAMDALHFLPYLAVVFPSKIVSVILDAFPQVIPLKHLVNALAPETHAAAASVLNFWLRQSSSEDLFEPLALSDLREIICVTVLGVAEQRAAAVYLNPSHRGWGGWRLGDGPATDSVTKPVKTLEQAQEDSMYPNCWFPTAAALWSPVDVIEVVLTCRQQLYQTIAETEAAIAATNSAVKASQNVMKQSGGHLDAMKVQRHLARHTPQQILALLSRKLSGLEASIMVFLKQYNVVHSILRSREDEDDSFLFAGTDGTSHREDSMRFSPSSPLTGGASSFGFDENICLYSNRLPSTTFVIPRAWSPRKVEELLVYFPEFLSLFDHYNFPRPIVDLDIIPMSIDRHLRLRTVHSLLPLLQYRPDQMVSRNGPSGGAYQDRSDAGLSASGLGGGGFTSTRSSVGSSGSGGGVHSGRSLQMGGGGMMMNGGDPTPSPAISEINWLNLLRKAHRMGCLEDAAYLTLTVHIQQPKRVRYLLRRAFPLLDVDDQVDPVVRRVRDKLAAIMN